MPMTNEDRRDLHDLRHRMHAAACDDTTTLCDAEIDRWHGLERAAAAEEQAQAAEAARVAGLRGVRRIEFALAALGKA